MSQSSPLEKIAHLHQLTFEDANRHMQTDKLAAYTGWVATHPDYMPTFATRLGSAVAWSKANPEKFDAMVADFDTALIFLNDTEAELDSTTFPNIAAYRAHRRGVLPRIGGQDVHAAGDVLAAARNSGCKLRWGETIKPEDGDYYSFHTFVASDQGMAAASLTDLYENYTRTLGLYPDNADIDAIVANAITEATFIMQPEGELFQTFKNPNDAWIYGYEGFSPQFQLAVYGEKPNE